MLLLLCLKCFSQDTLPKFSCVLLGEDKARISWTNPFENCVQLSVQRSYDSLNFFQTIFSSLSPELPQNGFVDKNYFSGIKIFYRISYVLDDGTYFFSKTKQATKNLSIDIENSIKTNDKKTQFLDTLRIANNSTTAVDVTINFIDNPKPSALPKKKMYSIYKKNLENLFNVIDEPNFLRFKDSIAFKTKDTLFLLDNEIVIWKPFIPLPLWKPSQNIFTTNKGYVLLQLNNAALHKYKIIFYEENGKEVFKIKNPKQDKLMLEKSNFLHEGWFYFELFEDEKLKEKNKFFIEKDF